MPFKDKSKQLDYLKSYHKSRTVACSLCSWSGKDLTVHYKSQKHIKSLKDNPEWCPEAKPDKDVQPVHHQNPSGGGRYSLFWIDKNDGKRKNIVRKYSDDRTQKIAQDEIELIAAQLNGWLKDSSTASSFSYTRPYKDSGSVRQVGGGWGLSFKGKYKLKLDTEDEARYALKILNNLFKKDELPDTGSDDFKELRKQYGW